MANQTDYDLFQHNDAGRADDPASEKLRTLSRIYDLPEMTYTEAVDEEFYEYCKGIQNFIVICISNREGEILFTRNITKNNGWGLPGGQIYHEEGIVDAVNRLVEREAGTSIDEVTPVAYMKNKFIRNGGSSYEANSYDSITHTGLALAAVTKAKDPELKTEDNVLKRFSSSTLSKTEFQDECVIDLAKPHLQDKIADLPQDEIESGREHRTRHILHKNIVSRFSRSSAQIKSGILDIIKGSPQTILDVSCGDDGFIFTMSDRFNPHYCVANDISWGTLSILQEEQNDPNIIFTNHNLHKLPFDMSFDLVLFKNTLHHIENKRQKDIIESLDAISDQLIIVDIEDPTEYSFKSKAWNWYYRHFLGDEGEDFLSFKDFKNIVRESIDGKQVGFGGIETVKGRYMVASARSSDVT